MEKSRAEVRNERADKIAREVRYQLGKYGGIKDHDKLLKLTLQWLKVSLKNCYERP